MKKRIISLVIAMAILVGILPTVLPPLKISALTVSSEKHSVDTSKLTAPTSIQFYTYKDGADKPEVEKEYTLKKNSTFTYKNKKDKRDGSASYKDGVLTLDNYDGGPIKIDGDIVILLKGEENKVASTVLAGRWGVADFLIYATGDMYILSDPNEKTGSDLYLECGKADLEVGRDNPLNNNTIAHLMADGDLFIYDSMVFFDNYYTGVVIDETVTNTMAKSTNIEDSWIYSYGGHVKEYDIYGVDNCTSLGDIVNARIVNSKVESDTGIFMFSEIINSELKLGGDIYGFGTIKDSTVNAQMIRHYAPENLVVQTGYDWRLYKNCVSEDGNEKLIIDNSKVTLKGDLNRYLRYGIKDEYGNFKLKDGTTMPETCNEAGIIIRNGSTVDISNVYEGIIMSVRGIDVIDSTLKIKVLGGYGIGNRGVSKYGGPESKHEYGLHVIGKSIVDVDARGRAKTNNLSFGFVAQDGYVPNNYIDLAPSSTTNDNYYVKFSGDNYGESTMPSAWAVPMTLGEYTRPTESGGTYSDGKLTPHKEKLVYITYDDYHTLKPGQEYRYTIHLQSYRKLTGSASLTGTVKNGRQVVAFQGAQIGVNTDNIKRWMSNPIFRYQWQYRDPTTSAWESISGETGATYRPTEDMIGKFIRVVVTALYHESEVISSTAQVQKFSGRPDTGGTTLWGDANGDDKIDSKDIILLKKYIANLDPATGKSSVSVEAGADANGDGKIDSKDIILLKKYIANLDPSTGKSSVTLGPSE